MPHEEWLNVPRGNGSMSHVGMAQCPTREWLNVPRGNGSMSRVGRLNVPCRNGSMRPINKVGRLRYKAATTTHALYGTILLVAMPMGDYNYQHVTHMPHIHKTVGISTISSFKPNERQYH